MRTTRTSEYPSDWAGNDYTQGVHARVTLAKLPWHPVNILWVCFRVRVERRWHLHIDPFIHSVQDKRMGSWRL